VALLVLGTCAYTHVHIDYFLLMSPSSPYDFIHKLLGVSFII
jgi:hypothetical protein